MKHWGHTLFVAMKYKYQHVTTEKGIVSLWYHLLITGSECHFISRLPFLKNSLWEMDRTFPLSYCTGKSKFSNTGDLNFEGGASSSSLMFTGHDDFRLTMAARLLHVHSGPPHNYVCVGTWFKLLCMVKLDSHKLNYVCSLLIISIQIHRLLQA